MKQVRLVGAGMQRKFGANLTLLLHDFPRERYYVIYRLILGQIECSFAFSDDAIAAGAIQVPLHRVLQPIDLLRTASGARGISGVR